MSTTKATHFLNVDLEVSASDDLAELVSALEPDAFALHREKNASGHHASFELALDPADAESAIRHFIRLVDEAPPTARILWNRATKRDFSIGIEAGHDTSSYELALPPDLLVRVAGINARIVVVIYTADGA